MIVSFGVCAVDLDRIEIHRDGELVAVEPQVFDVLAYLIEHRERLVTKEELLDNVWGDRFVSESALTSRIKSARQAVGDDGKNQAIIRTVHGRGYRFVAEVDVLDPVGTDAPQPSVRPVSPASPDAMTATVAGLDPDAEPADDRTWPLVGRHDELATLERSYHDRDCHGVVLTGPAGIGKTRLATECARLAERAGSPVARAHGNADAKSVPLAGLAHLLPPDLIDAADRPADMARTAVFLRARAALEELAGDQRLVLVVDDADQLDDLSAALLASLAGSGAIFVVLTQRTGPGDTVVLDELVRSNQLTRVDLAPLDDTDLDVLLYRVLAGPIDLGSLEQLTTLAQGVPGALEQLVEASLANRSLDRESGVWRLVGPLRPTVASAGRHQVDLAELGPAAVAGAELLAVAVDLDLDLATDLIGADALDVLDRSGLLAVTVAGGRTRVSLAQRHVALLLRDQLGPLRARRYKSQLAAAIADADVTPQDRLRMARWAIETGVSPDRAQLMEAARYAVAIADPEAADVVLDHIDEHAPGPDARQLRAELAFRRGQMDAAEAMLDEIADADLGPEVSATVARRRATILFHVRGRFDEALEVLEAEHPGVTAETQPLLDAHWIGLQGFMGRADSLLAKASAVPDDLAGPPRLEVLRGRIAGHLLTGAIGEALELVDEHERGSLELAPGAAQAGNEVVASFAIAAHAARGDLRRASELIREHLPPGRRSMLAWLPMAAARVELAVGRPRAARALIGTPLAAVRSQNLLHAEPLMTAIHARTSMSLGDPDAARREADVAAEAIGSLDGQLLFALVFSIADVWCELGEHDRAIEILDPSIERARVFGARLTEAELLATKARAGAAADVAERVDELARSIEGDLWPVRNRHVQALADGGDPAVLDEVAAGYRRLGAVRLADVTQVRR